MAMVGAEACKPKPACSKWRETVQNSRQATINLGRFPANTQVEALLGLPGESANLLVASGQTNDNGSTQLDFVMPEKWQDGSPLSEQDLLLEVRSVDGSYRQSATIQYDH